MTFNRLAYGCLLCAALLATAGCSKKKTVSSGSANCLADASACCALATQDGDANPDEGKDGCTGSNIDTEGEWCDQAAELAKKLLEAESVDGECALGLKPNTVTRVPLIWVNSTNENKVAQFDSTTGEETLRVNTWGSFPNRTAVANDGSVWITNRNSYQYIHIGKDGEPVCASPYGPRTLNNETQKYEGTGYTRAAAIDSEGNAWIGFNDTPYAVVKVHPSEVEEDMVTVTNPTDASTMEVPRCKELARIEMMFTAPYGLVADGAGTVWVGTLSGPYYAKIDAVNNELIEEFNITEDPKYAMAAPDGLGSSISFYGMAIDTGGNPWIGNSSHGVIIGINKDTGAIQYLGRSPMTGDAALNGATQLSYARSLGIDTDGNIWVADNSYPYAHQFNAEGEWLQAVKITCPDTDDDGPDAAVDGSGLLGIGSDIDGNMWVSMQSTQRVAKFTTEGELIGCYPEPVYTDGVLDYTKLLSSPYTYSDLTGSTNSIVTSQLGKWRGVVDPEGDDPLVWTAIAFEGRIPDGTSVCFRVRAGNSTDELEAAAFSSELCADASNKFGPFFVVNLLNGDDEPLLEKTSMMEMELKLSSTDEAETPQVTNLSVAAFK